MSKKHSTRCNFNFDGANRSCDEQCTESSGIKEGRLVRQLAAAADIVLSACRCGGIDASPSFSLSLTELPIFFGIELGLLLVVSL